MDPMLLILFLDKDDGESTELMVSTLTQYHQDHIELSSFKVKVANHPCL